MKLLLLSIVLVVAFVALEVEGRKEIAARFSSWKARFGKKNEDKETEERRMEVFENNTRIIDEQNEKFLNGESSFSCDVNEHSALLDHEKKNVKGLLHAKPRIQKRSIGPERWSFGTGRVTFNPYHKNSSVPVKTAVDWRKVWTKAIDNQGSCGSCWAFSAAAVIDAVFKIKKNLIIDSSEQQLVDCSGYLGNGGCNGGVPFYALEYSQTKGLDVQTAYKSYNGYTNTCTRTTTTTTTGSKISGFVWVDNDDVALKQAIDELGPCVIGIDVDDTLWMNYKGGVYDGPCSNVPADADHAVVVVGYGTDATNGPYWIIRNSWGTGWGEGGYMRMSQKTANKCGITNQVACAVLK